MKSTEKNLLKGILAGVAAGLVATYVMTQYQNLTQNIFLGEQTDDSDKQDDDPATVKAANMITENVFGHELEKDEKETAGQLMHYLMGGVSGAIYGATTEYTDIAKRGSGFPFGTAVWAIADDFVVPALGLAKSPTQTSVYEHAYALSSHWVYGAVSEYVRGSIRDNI
jgi:putative membrane protein